MRLRTAGGIVAGILGLSWVVRAAWGLPSALGASISAIAPTAVEARSYRNRRFHNTEPATLMRPSSGAGLLVTVLTRLKAGRPLRAIPLAKPAAPMLGSDLAVTWYGHASALVEIDGYRVLTDPVWSDRVSPSRLIGPARLHPVPVALAELPSVHAIVISHDHYDHLDSVTVRGLVRTQRAPFVVPIGIGAHLRRWGVPEERIIELDWESTYSLADPSGERAPLNLVCMEARHFSGRGLARNTTLWASWALMGPEHSAYFGGDTGYTQAFSRSGAKYGPYDLTLLPIGAYDEQWADIHMNPEEAVRAHADLCRGDAGYGVMIPIHWATFNLAFHSWSEPVRRMVEAAETSGTTIAVPQPGQRLDLSDLPPGEAWWEDID